MASILDEPGKPCLEVENLSVSIPYSHGELCLVKNISFTLNSGEILGLVGESGSGKSLTAQAILGLLADKGIECSGRILFEGQDLLKLPQSQLRSIRGRKISMVFQDPLTALNPVLSIGRQVRELFMTHEGASFKEAADKSVSLLKRAGLPQAERVYKQFPHQLSGGMRQRVCIAMAMALKPALIIADEPTTALDVTLQAQILLELKRMQTNCKSAILLISHDMGVIAEMADKVAVMQKGTIVETNDCYSLFDYPSHEYTKNLLAASRLDGLTDFKKPQELAVVL